MIERKKKRTARIGIFAVAHNTYFGQFEGLYENLMKYHGELCSMVEKNEVDFGVLICTSGVGMSMCANKHNGIRAALASDTFSARMTRIHNNANVLCMGARVIGSCLAEDIVDSFLGAEFESGGRHEMRVNMMTEIENKQK